MEQTKSSKKLSYAVIGLAVALVAVVGGLIGVYAATQQTVGSSFDVQYQIAGDIAGAVSAKYQVLNGQETSMGSVSFAVTDGDKNASLTDAGEIELSATNKSVTFTYDFTNVGEHDYVATLTDTTDYTNVEVKWTGLTDGAVEVKADGTAQVTCTVTIIDTNKSAHYTSSASTTALSWALVSTYTAG